MKYFTESASKFIAKTIKGCFLSLSKSQRGKILNWYSHQLKELNATYLQELIQTMNGVFENNNEYSFDLKVKRIEIDNKMKGITAQLKDINRLKTKYCGI